MLLKSYFRQVIFYMYPKDEGLPSDIYSLLDRSVEFERLRNLCSQFYNNSEYIQYLSDFKASSPYPKLKITLDERIGVENKRCFSLKISLEKKELKNHTNEETYLIINFSILIPYYTIDVVKQTYLLGSLVSSTEILAEEDYSDYFAFYRTYISKSGLQEFPKNLYGEKVPEIIFPDIEKGEFTFFNAFFLNSFDDVTGF